MKERQERLGSINGHEYSAKEQYPLEKGNELITFKDETKKGERVMVDICRVENDGSESNIINIWYRNKTIKERLASYWHITVYATDQNGFTWGRYNPQLKPGGTKINFDYVYEATEENKNKLLEEISRRAFAD
jgi:hypothetical protein